MTIVNPFFQDANWQTAPSGDPRGPGNQIPSGWILKVTPQGQPMPWPSKHSAEGDVAALAGGPGEHVHKLSNQLPASEQLGQPRALLVLPNTNKIYKLFGNIPQAAQLQQVIREPAGTQKKYTLYILGETANQPTPPLTKLEDDHFRVAFTFGDIGVQRTYVEMSVRHNVIGNERAWNKLEVQITFPDSGELMMNITCQQNWPGATDFFVAGVTEETISTPPGDGDNPPPGSSPVAAKLAMIELRLLALSKQAMVTSNDVDAMRQQIQSLEFEEAALKALLLAA